MIRSTTRSCSCLVSSIVGGCVALFLLLVAGSIARNWVGVIRQPAPTQAMHAGSNVTSLAWSPNGNLLASGSVDTVIRVWNPKTGQLQFTLLGHSREVNSLAWNPDGSRLASTGWYDASLRIWDVQTRQSVLVINTNQLLNSVCWSPDGKQLATSSESQAIYTWNAANGKQLTEFTPGSARQGISWNPDGIRIASGSGIQSRIATGSGYNSDAPSLDKGLVIISDAATGDRLLELRGHTGLIRATAWSPDGKLLASGGNDGAVIIWEPTTSKRIRSYRMYQTIEDIHWRPDGKIIASVGESNIRIWNPSTGNTLATIYPPNSAFPALLSWGFTTIEWSPDGSQLAASDRKGNIYIWNYDDLVD